MKMKLMSRCHIYEITILIFIFSSLFSEEQGYSGWIFWDTLEQIQANNFRQNIGKVTKSKTAATSKWKVYGSLGL